MPAYRLELPASANDLVRPALLSSMRCGACGHAPTKRPIVRLVSTAEAKAFREHAHRRLPQAPVAGPIEVYCTFYVDRVNMDVDNRLKSLLDAMKGRLFHDDVQVAELHVTKVVTTDESKVGVVVEVRPADPQEHPELSRRLGRSSIADKEAEARQWALGLTSKETPKTGSVAAPVRPSAVPGETVQQRLNRLAKPATYSPDDPEAA